MKTKELFLTVRVLISSEKSMDSLEEMKTSLMVAVSTSKTGKDLYIQEVELTDVEDKDEQNDEEQSDEVKRQIQIIRINNCVRKNRGGIKLEDYNLSLHIGERKVSIVQENYVFIEDSIGDDDIDFEDMDDDEIDELHEIIDQVEIIDEKTMRRTEN